MALVESNYFGIGKTAPDFTLLDSISNTKFSLSELKGNKGTVIMFICNHCPFVVHVNEELVRLANDYLAKEIGFIAIASNDIDRYPQDGPVYMKEVASKLNYPFHYLFDENQNVAKDYEAACTPDFYVFDANLKSVYHGQLDNSRPSNGIPVTGSDIRNALDTLISNTANLQTQKPSIGCSIKWKN
jgi:thiol-disulfide isomerase/thioredoxin